MISRADITQQDRRRSSVQNGYTAVGMRWVDLDLPALSGSDLENGICCKVRTNPNQKSSEVEERRDCFETAKHSAMWRAHCRWTARSMGHLSRGARRHDALRGLRVHLEFLSHPNPWLYSPAPELRMHCQLLRICLRGCFECNMRLPKLRGERARSFFRLDKGGCKSKRCFHLVERNMILPSMHADIPGARDGGR